RLRAHLPHEAVGDCARASIAPPGGGRGPVLTDLRACVRRGPRRRHPRRCWCSQRDALRAEPDGRSEPLARRALERGGRRSRRRRAHRIPAPPDAMILRVGALVDDLVVDAWVAAALAEVEECESAQLALLVVNAEPRPNRSLRRLMRHLLYFAYQGLDRARNAQDDPFARLDLGGRFPD